MSSQSVPRTALDFFPSRPVEFELSAAPLSSDAGLLVFRQYDEQIRLIEQFAAELEDRRDPTASSAAGSRAGRIKGSG